MARDPFCNKWSLKVLTNIVATRSEIRFCCGKVFVWAGIGEWLNPADCKSAA